MSLTTMPIKLKIPATAVRHLRTRRPAGARRGSRLAARAWKDHAMSPSDVLTRAARPPDQVLRYGPGHEQFADLRLPVRSEGGEIRRFGGGMAARMAGRDLPAWRVLAVGVRPHPHRAAGRGARVGRVRGCTPEYRRTGQRGGGWPGTFDDVAAAVERFPGWWPPGRAGGRADPGAGGAGGALGRGAPGAVGGGAGGCRLVGGGASRCWLRLRSAGWSAWLGCATWRRAPARAGRGCGRGADGRRAGRYPERYPAGGPDGAGADGGAGAAGARDG